MFNQSFYFAHIDYDFANVSKSSSHYLTAIAYPNRHHDQI